MSSSQHVTLNTGQRMPLVGFGTSGGYDDVMRKALSTALEFGYRSIDTAYLYMNEEAIGDELQDWFSKGKLQREEVFVTSKLPAIANRAQDVNRFLTKSLKKLKLNYLDLYLIHHPFGLQCVDENICFPKDDKGICVFDYDTDFKTLWKALEAEVDTGRIKAIGLSNFNSQQIERIMQFSKHPPAVLQVEVHAYFQQRPLVEFCQRIGLVVTAYSPIGAPHTKEGMTVSPVLLQNPTVLEIGNKYGKSAGQILLKFLVEREIVIIPKSVTDERIKSNFDIMDFALTKEDMKRLADLDRGEPGRVYHFKDDFPGCPNHKEYPFHAKF